MPQTQNSAAAAVFRSEPRRLIGALQNPSRCSVAAVAAVTQPGQNSAGAAEHRLKLEPLVSFLYSVARCCRSGLFSIYHLAFSICHCLVVHIRLSIPLGNKMTNGK